MGGYGLHSSIYRKKAMFQNQNADRDRAVQSLKNINLFYSSLMLANAAVTRADIIAKDSLFHGGMDDIQVTEKRLVDLKNYMNSSVCNKVCVVFTHPAAGNEYALSIVKNKAMSENLPLCNEHDKTVSMLKSSLLESFSKLTNLPPEIYGNDVCKNIKTLLTTATNFLEQLEKTVYSLSLWRTQICTDINNQQWSMASYLVVQFPGSHSAEITSNEVACSVSDLFQSETVPAPKGDEDGN